MQLALHALPDWFAVVILAATIVALLVWRAGAVRLMVAGSILGVLRSRLLSLSAKAALRPGNRALTLLSTGRTKTAPLGFLFIVA